MAYVRAILDGKDIVTVIESRDHEGKKGHVVSTSLGFQWFPSERVKVESINGVRIPKKVIKYSMEIEYPSMAFFMALGKTSSTAG